MKMIPGDRIIARPLILKILDFPIAGIPFAILPNKGGGRHSGWLMPSFGFDNINYLFITSNDYACDITNI